jgi:transcriptional regulator with XRE-family HTH domain
MTVIQPPVRRRIVGAILRQYRQDMNYSLDDAARILDCDRSKISRIETGQRGIRNRELCDLLTEYGANIQVQKALSKIVNPRSIRNSQWQTYIHNLPDAYIDMTVLEITAPHIMVYEAQQIPDLLQSEEYAYALADECADLTSPSLQQLLTGARLTTQEIVLSEPRPEIEVVIGETALRHMPGDPTVKRAQLAALASVNSMFPEVHMQVLLSENEPHATRGAGSFTILRYAQVFKVVYLRGISGGTFVEDQREIAMYELGFRQLTASALTPGASATLIKQIQHGNTQGKER